jgi:hypothetical protein
LKRKLRRASGRPIVVDNRTPGLQLTPVRSQAQAGPRVPAPPAIARMASSEAQRALVSDLVQYVSDHPVARDQPLVAVVVPVLRRPHRVAPLVQSFRATTDPSEARLYFVAQASDMAEIDAIRSAGLEPIIVGDVDQSWARKINRGYERTTEPWILLAADDLRFHPRWLDEVRAMLLTFQGVIGTNDLGSPDTANGNRSTHPFVNRAYAAICGTADERNKICHEGYHHNFPDTELVMTAKARGMFRHSPRCCLEHLHPLWGKAPHDEIYKLGMSRWYEDQALFYRRVAAHGFQ